jgi:hypothetical protein
MRLHRTLRLAICLLLAWSAMPATADYKSTYKDAISAIDGDEWQSAAQLLEQAIKEQPTAGGRIRVYGSRWAEYNPYLLLARVYTRLDRAADACAPMEESFRQDKVRGDEVKRRNSLNADLQPFCQKAAADAALDVARAQKQIRDGMNLVTQVRDKMKASGFAALEKQSPQWLGPLTAQLDAFPGLSSRLNEAKTQPEVDAVTRDAESGIRTFREGLNSIASGLDNAEFESAFVIAEGNIKKARGLDSLSSTRAGKLDKDSGLKKSWNLTGTTLAEADGKMKQSFKTKDLALVQEADQLAQQVLSDRERLLKEIDSIKAVQQDPMAEEIAKRERRSDDLIQQANGFTSPSADLKTRRAAVDQTRKGKPRPGAKRGELTAYASTLKDSNDALASEITREPGRQEIAAELRDIIESRKEAERLLKRAAGIASPPTQLIERTRDLQSILAEKAPGSSDSVSFVRGHRKRLQRANTAIGQAFPAVAVVDGVVPAELKNAFDAFSQGKYSEVEKALAGVRYDGDRANLQLNLFRAAALFARYVRSGETDASLLEQVQGAVRECRKIQSGYQPGELFSPRFRDFYRDS